MVVCAKGKEKQAIFFHTHNAVGGICLVLNNFALCMTDNEQC